MKGTLDRECARLSRGPRGTGLGGFRVARVGLAHAREPGRGDRSARGERNRLVLEGRERPRRRATARRSGKRAVKRASPRSRLRGAAPSLPRLLCSSLDVRSSTRKDARVVGHGAARLRDESGPRADAERPPRYGTLRRETTEYGCSSRNGFGVQKSIGRIAGRDARESAPSATHGHARLSSKESRGQGTAPARRSSEDGARASRRAATIMVTREGSKPHAQASSGSHPEGCGLGDSGSPRAASVWLPVRWKGVRVVNVSP
jgi:hypothetical protein